MTDTPQHVQDLQLKIWMQKSPGERLYQALKNNQELLLFFSEAREAMQKVKQQSIEETKERGAGI